MSFDEEVTFSATTTDTVGECVEGSYFTYIFSREGLGKTEIACNLGFEYVVLPLVDIEAICYLCNVCKNEERGKNR